MEMTHAGIDVSKDQLDVHLAPSGQAFVAARNGEGLEELCRRLAECAPTLIAVEATGGFEAVITAALCPLSSSTRRKCAPTPGLGNQSQDGPDR